MPKSTIRYWIVWSICAFYFAIASRSNAQPEDGPRQLDARVSSELVSRGFVGLTRSDARVKGEVVLTFDDGPHPTHTPRVLRLLEQQGLRATFFLVGVNINRHTIGLVQQMYRAGHLLGSHSYDHDVSMADGRFGPDTTQYIRGQHEVTQILVELALLAQSGEDFDALYRRVFAAHPTQRLSPVDLIRKWPDYVARHRMLLDSEGYTDETRPYALSFTRPPGGGPYLGVWGTTAQRRYDQALRQLGWLNVLWHDGCWDPDPARRNDPDFIVASLGGEFQRGGIVVIHDNVHFAALARALRNIRRLSGVKVISLDEFARKKYGFELSAVVTALRDHRQPATSRVAQSAPSARRPAI